MFQGQNCGPFYKDLFVASSWEMHSNTTSNMEAMMWAKLQLRHVATIVTPLHAYVHLVGHFLKLSKFQASQNHKISEVWSTISSTASTCSWKPPWSIIYSVQTSSWPPISHFRIVSLLDSSRTGTSSLLLVKMQDSEPVGSQALAWQQMVLATVAPSSCRLV